jgi:hypothetical protein
VARWFIVVVTACGRIGFDAGGSETSCTAETDAELCTRLAKCETVSAIDNCGQPRTADCGACAGGLACVASTCTAPVCGTAYMAAPGNLVAGLSVMNKQSALLGVSGTGGTILYLQATVDCVVNGTTLQIADGPPYVPVDITALSNLGVLAKVEETMTLTADGLAIIGVAPSGFVMSRRSAIAMIDFSPATADEFATLDGALPPVPATLAWPLMSADGLSFTYKVNGATDSSLDGIYESVRASTAMPFSVATKVAGAVQSYDGISGISSDRMTAFVSMPFATQIVVRTSLSQPFEAPASSMPPGLAWRVVPTSDCATVFGTCEPGGCPSEKLCTWAKQ